MFRQAYSLPHETGIKDFLQSEDIAIMLLCNQMVPSLISHYQCSGCFYPLIFPVKIFMADFSHETALFPFTDVISSPAHGMWEWPKVSDEEAYFQSCCMCSCSWLDCFSQRIFLCDLQWPHQTFDETLIDFICIAGTKQIIDATHTKHHIWNNIYIETTKSPLVRKIPTTTISQSKYSF